MEPDEMGQARHNPHWPYGNETTILHAGRGITIKFNLAREMWELSVASNFNFLRQNDAVVYYHRHFDAETGEPKANAAGAPGEMQHRRKPGEMQHRRKAFDANSTT
jgi:hypothetical protein